MNNIISIYFIDAHIWFSYLMTSLKYVSITEVINIIYAYFFTFSSLKICQYGDSRYAV
jgi:hypothetical protein